MAEEGDLEKVRAALEQLHARVARLEQALGMDATSLPAQRVSEPAPERRDAPPWFAHISPQKEPRADTGQNLESRIGSQWFNRIGIVAVLIGVALFLKYAFQNNWIGPVGRVSVGLLAGIAIVIWSELFRRHGHRGFSYSLKAVGIGTLYLSLWAAFQVYQLIPANAAFAAMIVVTAATSVLALAHEAEILAALALVGGFATPVLLSTGQNREAALFGYLAVLDVATLVLTIIRPWSRLIAVAFVGTVVLYVGWYADFYDRPQLEPTLVFTIVFFAIFAVAPVVAARKKFDGSLPQLLLVLPLVNAGVFFLQLYGMLHEISRTALAWVAAALAALYLVLSRRVRARAAADAQSARVLYLLHVALAIGFLTTAIPLKLEAHWITIGWLVESAVLIWIGYRTASDFLKTLATAALVLGVARLIVVDDFAPEHLFLNARFATYVIAIAAVAWAVALAKKSGSATQESAAAVGVVAINLLAIVTLSREINDNFERQITGLARVPGRWSPEQFQHLHIARQFAFSALWMAYGAVLMWIGFWRRSSFLRWQALALLILTIGKVFIYDVSQLERGYRILSFIALGVLLLAISFLYQRDWLKLARGGRGAQDNSGPA